MTDKTMDIHPVLLAGGVGTRLWPVSRELHPKQLVRFIGADSLIQNTIKRLAPEIKKENVRVVCGAEHYHEIARHIAELGVHPEGKVIAEPCGRNTAPAILLAVLNILEEKKDALLCVFPADHVIQDVDTFHDRLKSALKLAETGYVVTFGIQPHYPETGYGYIEGAGKISDGALHVKRFIEKPDRDDAVKYIKAGNFFWNSGMFTFKASVIEQEFKKLQPRLHEMMKEMISKKSALTIADYKQLPNISIDYAIMEKTDKCVVLPSNFGWSDIGSWKSLYDFLPKDKNNNVIDGDVITKETQNCFLMSCSRLIATNKIKDLVVIETPDAVFVSDLEHSRDVKEIVNELKRKNRREYQKHPTVHHPWGTFTLMDKKKDFRVAGLTIYPGSRINLNADSSIAKHMIISHGLAKLKTEGKASRLLKQGESVVISENESIELENPGKDALYIIQVRTVCK